MNITFLIQLLLAHLLTDFVIQKDNWVKHKNDNALKSKYFWVHIATSGILTYILLQQWKNWQIPLFIIISHGLVDYWKIIKERSIIKFNNINNGENAKSATNYFFLDQLFHIIIIIIAWLILTKGFNKVIPFIESFFSNKNIVTILTSLVLLIWPVGITIDKVTENLRKKIDTSDSLGKAGMYIGTFERILVYIFILIGQYAAIGFLIASKSILRITRDNDEDGRKKTEYVLIGTLISFTFAILVGMLAKYILQHKT